MLTCYETKWKTNQTTNQTTNLMLLDTYIFTYSLFISFLFGQMETLDLQKHKLLFLFSRKSVRIANSVQESELLIKQKL